MSGISSREGSGGNKLDTELNLVPFIDLLSTLTLFLLLTVVWVQIAAIPASVDSKGKSSVSATDQSKLLVRVTARSYELTWPTAFAELNLPRSTTSLDSLTRLVAATLKSGKPLPASVSGEDSAAYGSIVQTLDALKNAGLTWVALSTE